MIDRDDFFFVWFYLFGNGEDFLEVVDVYIFFCYLIKVYCKGDIMYDKEMNMCV